MLPHHSTAPSDPDLALVRRVLESERFAFDQLYQNQFPRVYTLAMRQLGSAALAEAATAAAFETLVGLLPAYRGERPLALWLSILLRHEISLRDGSARAPLPVDRRRDASPVP